MEKELKKLLDSQVLSEDVKEAIVSGYEEKITQVKNDLEKIHEEKLTESKRNIEEQVKRDFAKQFASEKEQMVEAMDKFLSDNIKKELSEFSIDRNELRKEKAKVREYFAKVKESLQEIDENKKILYTERVKLTKAITEAKKEYKSKVSEHLKLLQGVVMEQMKKELSEFELDKKELKEQAKSMKKDVYETKQRYKKEFVEHATKLENFFLRQMTKELYEFEEDKKLLGDERARLIVENKEKLEETKKALIERSVKIIENTILPTMKKELHELKEDFKVQRENNFGRVVFEAIAEEYMTSYLSEGSQVKKLTKELNETAKKAAELKKLVEAKELELSTVSRKIKLVEENSLRTKIMNELMSPLPKDKKVMMMNLLENKKTDKLKETFNRYLPIVMKEEKTSVVAPKVITETKNTKTTETPKIVISGDRTNRLSETIIQEESDSKGMKTDMTQLRKLAGL